MFSSRKFFITALVILICAMTAMPLWPGKVFLFPVAVSSIVVLTAYGAFAWLLLAILGKCPLRWLSLSPWVFLIAFAHAYWVEFLQGWWDVTAGVSSLWHLLSAAVGAFAGIRLRLSYTYRKCNCSLSESLDQQQGAQGMSAVSHHPDVAALVTHHPTLPTIIAQSFGWKPMTIRHPDGWQLNLICTGRSLVSLPHFSYGAFFNDGNGNAEVSMYNYLQKLHFVKGFNGLEYRQLASQGQENGFKVVSWLKLNERQGNESSGFSSTIRRKISKARRSGLEVKAGGIELLKDFYPVYARHMHHLGSGALPLRFFRKLLAGYDGHDSGAFVFILYHKGKPQGAACNLFYRDFYENEWFATTPAVQKIYGSYALHAAMIDHAISLGSSLYSFGQSTAGSGVHLFKKHWNTTDVPLQWMNFPQQSRKLRKQSWLRTIWKRMPYGVAKYIGRWVAKWVY